MDLKLDNTRLLVDHIEVCRDFYKNKLGLSERIAVAEGVYYVFATDGGSLALYKRELMESVGGVAISSEKKADKAVLVFSVEDVDATYKELTAKGIQFIREPHNQETWEIRVAHFRDPEGNLIEIEGPLKQ